MLVPLEIKTIIQQIEVLESTSKKLWNELYKWFESNNVNISDERGMTLDIVINLKDGVGSAELIQYLEKL